MVFVTSETVKSFSCGQEGQEGFTVTQSDGEVRQEDPAPDISDQGLVLGQSRKTRGLKMGAKVDIPCPGTDRCRGEEGSRLVL